jgi:cytochrome c-type biogenesis protein CcmH
MMKHIFNRVSVWLILLSLFLGLTGKVMAAIDAYEFSNTENEARFRTLITELRCPKCQNQSVGDSDAELSKDIKDRVYRQIETGRTDDEIIDFMVQRYGDFVTYRPALRVDTLLLWGGPFLIGITALFVLLSRFFRRSQRKVVAVVTPLTDSERHRLAQILEESNPAIKSESAETPITKSATGRE